MLEASVAFAICNRTLFGAAQMMLADSGAWPCGCGSHCSVFTAVVEAHERQPDSGVTNVRFAKLNLIDLAGGLVVGGMEECGWWGACIVGGATSELGCVRESPSAGLAACLGLGVPQHAVTPAACMQAASGWAGAGPLVIS